MKVSETSTFIFETKLKKESQRVSLGVSIDILENLSITGDLSKVRTMLVEMMQDYQAKEGNILDKHERNLLLDVYHILDIN